jgi:thiol:disulfide interchange protein DsbD
MESEVLSKPEVSSMLHNDFIVASLYVDEKRELPENEKYTSKFDGSKINNVGAKHLDFEATIANYNAQPLYIFTDQQGNIIKNAGGYEPGVERFVQILNEVKNANKIKYP